MQRLHLNCNVSENVRVVVVILKEEIKMANDQIEILGLQELDDDIQTDRKSVV
jgi:hypothetical protein